jgi:hypothetical protein
VTTSSFINWLLGDPRTAHRRAYRAALRLAVVTAVFGDWTHLAAAGAGTLAAIGWQLRQRALDEPVLEALLSAEERRIRGEINNRHDWR